MADEPSIIDYFHSPPPPNSSTFACFTSGNTVILISTDLGTYVLLVLPLYMLLCYLGFHPQKQQRSQMLITHSDHFTFQSIVMQLLELFAFAVFFCGGYTNDTVLAAVGMSTIGVTSSGQSLFHNCTCAERYVAVVHPITYMALRPSTRVRIRNITIGCVWIISLASTSPLLLLSYRMIVTLYFCVLFMSFTLVSFFCISVLCALKHPGPGKGGRDRKQADQSKQKAFWKIMVIMVVSLSKFVSLGLCVAINFIMNYEICMIFLFGMNFWFMLPSYLMLPLLYIHKTMKLQQRK